LVFEATFDVRILTVSAWWKVVIFWVLWCCWPVERVGDRGWIMGGEGWVDEE